MVQFDTDVIVIGGGIAGLAAARELARNHLRVILLEASYRIGGRLLTLSIPDIETPLELGAEFIHGQPQDLLSLIQQAGLHVEEVSGNDYCYEDGRLRCCEDSSEFDVLEELKEYTGPDTSFSEYIRQQDIAPHVTEEARGYVEGFNAADADSISIHALAAQQKAEDAIGGDRAFRVVEGYTSLAEYVHQMYELAGGQTQLKAVARRVDWTAGEVKIEVEGEEGSVRWLTANRAVIAVPLGVLQSGGITFLPAPKMLEAARGMVMGPVHRMVLVFRERFWATEARAQGDMGFLFAEANLPGVFWTRSPSAAPLLTVWVGGRRTGEVVTKELLDRALSTLGTVFQMSKEALYALLVSFHIHEWNADPLSRGAYSYVSVGGIESSTRLSEPIDATLFFCGEHTDTTGHWGTVHGALRSGVRAAEQVLEAARLLPPAIP